MPTNPNMVAIQTVTVGAGGAANITFSSIPQTYTDLVVKTSIRSDAGGGDCRIEFNGSGGTAYTGRILYGSGSGAASASHSGQAFLTWGGLLNRNTTTGNTFASNEIYIPNYTSSNNKSVSVDGVEENNATEAYSGISAGLWSNSAAITSIKLTPSAGNFVQYSTATLYGVTSAGYGAKATGGIITQDANYYYHTFLASGTFTPTSNITADYLVVAGGGGGGYNHGGGGGAGGLRCTVTATGGGGSLESALSLTASTNYTVTVGAGGAGATGTGSPGSNGSNSVFSSITSTGGGGGGTAGAGQYAGVSGGSGGGARLNQPFSGGAGTANQGYAGGSATTGTGAGGGGGAGAVGQNGIDGAGTNLTGGVGGNGVQITSLATPTSTGANNGYYAGGGGGAGEPSGQEAAGGLGGGGAGKAIFGAVGGAATVNTGGGGGGSGDTATGGAGGSGIVIVRYAK